MTSLMQRIKFVCISTFLGVTVAACGSGGGTTTASYTISGTISGLSGSGLVLQNNGGNNQSVSASATSFSFTTAIASGSTYSVSVLTQPSSPSQSCTIANGSGTVASANVTNVTITCIPKNELVSRSTDDISLATYTTA